MSVLDCSGGASPAFNLSLHMLKLGLKSICIDLYSVTLAQNVVLFVPRPNLYVIVKGVLRGGEDALVTGHWSCATRR